MKEEHHRTGERVRFSPIPLVALLLTQVLIAVSAASAEPGAPPQSKYAENAATGTPEPGGSSTAIQRAPGQNVRVFIASLLERLPRLRTRDDDAPKLVKAEIAGPVENKPLFRAKAATLYCTQFDLIFTNRTIGADHAVLSANVAFEAPEDGKQKVDFRVTNIYSRYADCKGAPFKPFPELEQLRDRRRRELGKADK
jgi:hypothetical protein